MALSPNINSREFDKFDESIDGHTVVRTSLTDGAIVNNIQNSAYGDVVTTLLAPVVSGNAVYGFIPANFTTNTSSGTATTSGNEFVVSSGTSLGNYGAIRSIRSVNYKAGVGAVIRFGARFPSNTATTWTGVGAFNLGDEVSFGYSGTSFGVWHRYNGLGEIRTLTLSAGASGNETVTLILNSVTYTIPITSGTAPHNAREIAAYLTANTTLLEGWQNGSKVEINFTSDGPKAGTFSFASTGTAAGSIATNTTGVTKTSDHIPISSWNGYDISSWFDPSKGNTYQIIFQNGYGDVGFFVEDSDSGKFQNVHTLRWSGLNTSTNVLNPSLRLGLYSTAIGATSSVSVYCPFITGFTSGTLLRTRNPRTYSNTKSISTTATNVFTIRCRKNYNYKSNQIEIQPLSASFANDGTKTAVFSIISAATVAGSPNYADAGTNLVSEIDTAGTTVTGGTTLVSYVVAKGTTLSVNLDQLQIRFPPGFSFTISARMESGAAADLTASLTWYEDV